MIHIEAPTQPERRTNRQGDGVKVHLPETTGCRPYPSTNHGKIRNVCSGKEGSKHGFGFSLIC